eukprot:scaffold3662_cov388-Prasinococcus_capsulatus_cf.AAC.5
MRPPNLFGCTYSHRWSHGRSSTGRRTRPHSRWRGSRSRRRRSPSSKSAQPANGHRDPKRVQVVGRGSKVEQLGEQSSRESLPTD